MFFFYFNYSQGLHRNPGLPPTSNHYYGKALIIVSVRNNAHDNQMILTLIRSRMYGQTSYLDTIKYTFVQILCYYFLPAFLLSPSVLNLFDDQAT